MTTENRDDNRGLVLVGLDGSNPLAFLAALGTLRTLSLAWPERRVRMGWTRHAGAWRPSVSSKVPLDAETLVQELAERLCNGEANRAFTLGDNLNVTPEEFRAFSCQLLAAAHESRDSSARSPVEFAAAFACDALANDQLKVQDTALRTMSGAGHQHFLASMRTIAANTQPHHLHKALFAPWKYDDPVARQSLRWDPLEDSRYALQWRDPSGDPTRRERGTMLGANRLAIEGLPLIACAPIGETLQTVGFQGRGARDTYWTWPIWDMRISLDVCRSLLANSWLARFQPDRAALLRSLGVRCVFRSQRITTGKFRNFTPAVALM